MRREERVTVQGPVKEQQPDGMSHRGQKVQVWTCHCARPRWTPIRSGDPPPARAHHTTKWHQQTIGSDRMGPVMCDRNRLPHSLEPSERKLLTPPPHKPPRRPPHTPGQKSDIQF